MTICRPKCTAREDIDNYEKSAIDIEGVRSMSLLELSHDRISDVIYTTKDKTIVIFQSYSFHEDQLAKKELSDEQRYSANNNSEIE